MSCSREAESSALTLHVPVAPPSRGGLRPSIAFHPFTNHPRVGPGHASERNRFILTLYLYSNSSSTSSSCVTLGKLFKHSEVAS